MHKCSICEKGLFQPDFLKSENGTPLYWASINFYTINQHEIFCGPKCSSEWYKDNRNKFSLKR